MFTQEVKLGIFQTLLEATDDEVVRMSAFATDMVSRMEFERSALPYLNEDHHFMYNLEGAKLARIIAQQRVKDIGKPPTEQEQNLRGLCAMLEIEHYQKVPANEDLPDLGEHGIHLN
ncbi:MAG: hypothetical protein JKY71_10010 [Alphaproteobacteria bacterium]|nr:hypothetical protein [Alphaproteobacteria bacterium]